MTQTDLTRPQGINRIDPVLRDAASELGIGEFRAETLGAEREHANRLAAERAAVVDTDGVAVESRSISGPGGQQLNLRCYRGGIKGAAGAPAGPAHGGQPVAVRQRRFSRAAAGAAPRAAGRAAPAG